MPHKFVIYRIIGNSLPPRHGPDDTYDNLQYVLENESELPSCDKRWLLNRLIDPGLEAKCIKLISASGQKYYTIPFDVTSYRSAFLDASGMPKFLNPFVKEGGSKIDSALLATSKEWILRHKSLAAINLNQARNKSIELGRADALWTLPLDGWCYFTTEAWDGFAQGVARNSDKLYGIIPLERLKKNMRPNDQPNFPEAVHEPQIAIRRDAPDRFDERLRYGRQNKAELLLRLGVPGPWEGRSPSYWDTAKPLKSTVPGRFFVSGWVYRLASSASNTVEASSAARRVARFEGVHRFTQLLDTAFLKKFSAENHGNDYCVLPPGFVCSNTGQVPVLLELAQAALAKPIRTVIDKTEIPPSGNRNDYLSLPRYMHDIDGKFIRIDGRSAETSIVGTEESHRHDREALQECFTQASILAASGVICRREDFLKRSAEILSAWFIDRDTAMNPTARFAQWKPDASAGGNFAGLIDFRELWTLPYLSNTLLVNGALSRPQHGAIKQWLARFLEFLAKSEQGGQAVTAGNNIGTWTHLLVVSLSLFAGNFAIAAAQLNNASLRLVAQCDVIGLQAAELSRTRPLHYSLLNLTAWILLANLGRSVGFDLWNYRGIEGQSICRMMHFVQANMVQFPEYGSEPKKYTDWYDALLLLVPGTAADRSLLAPQHQGTNHIWKDDPDSGLPPQWQIFLHGDCA